MVEMTTEALSNIFTADIHDELDELLPEGEWRTLKSKIILLCYLQGHAYRYVHAQGRFSSIRKRRGRFV